MNCVKFEGEVITGKGDGKKYVSLPWVKQQMEDRLGFTPYLGTLNLQLTKESVLQKKLLRKEKSKIIYPEEGYCTGLLFDAYVKGIKCAVVAPKIEDYPRSVLELIAAMNLRKTLKLEDGDTVSVLVKI